jgi:hypothetical protein
LLGEDVVVGLGDAEEGFADLSLVVGSGGGDGEFATTQGREEGGIENGLAEGDAAAGGGASTGGIAGVACGEAGIGADGGGEFDPGSGGIELGLLDAKLRNGNGLVAGEGEVVGFFQGDEP